VQISQICTRYEQYRPPEQAAPNGGSRVLAATSDRDTGLQMLEGTSDLIEYSLDRAELV